VKYPDITYEDAYEIQGVLIKKLQEKGMKIAGKKVGLTSNAMRKTANIFEPDYGFIFSDLCYNNESEIPIKNFIAPRIECEIAFKLCEDLDKTDITNEDIIKATKYVVCCMEICDFRMVRDKYQRKIQDSIADDAAFGGYILGDNPINVTKYDLTTIPYSLEMNNKQIEVSCEAAVYNDPASSMAWLANTFYKIGEPLKKVNLYYLVLQWLLCL
jgi:2-oxopent-4-enoate/cis-2-oxohex-4-enoate hydratase